MSSEVGQSITIIDAATHKVLDTVSLAYNADVKPVGMAITSNGADFYVANGRANTVSLLDTQTFQIQKTIAVGQRVWGIGLSSSSGKLYAANGLSNDISVIDTATNTLVATIPGGQGPWGIAIRE